jgi:membrane protein implicated in regulation of membrane protease activity
VDSPETWRWIWLAVAIAFGVGEMASAGTFFLAPFAIAALVAALLAFFDVGIGWQWLAFLAVAGVTFLALRPLARRLDRDYSSTDVGAQRWSNRRATVLEGIGEGIDSIGLVRMDREEWRAQSADGRAIPEGATVRVVRAEGTRVVVEPIDDGGPRLLGPS